jgi:hemerythrin
MLDYPQVALDFMNRDHAEFIELRKELLGLLTRQAADAEVDALLDKLLRHTRRHFAEEERLMQAAQFPPYLMHKTEHDRVLADMESRIAQWRQQRDAGALRQYAEEALADWFTGHVGMMDLVTAKFIAAQQKAA